MTAIYSVQIFGETYRMKADFSQASDPILFEGGDGEYGSCGRQVADYRHEPADAMRAYLEELVIECGDDPEECEDEIAAATKKMTAVDA